MYASDARGKVKKKIGNAQRNSGLFAQENTKCPNPIYPNSTVNILLFGELWRRLKRWLRYKIGNKQGYE